MAPFAMLHNVINCCIFHYYSLFAVINLSAHSLMVLLTYCTNCTFVEWISYHLTDNLLLLVTNKYCKCHLFHTVTPTHIQIIFIARQHTAADARYWYSNSVRLSVRPSVRDRLVLYENGLTYRHSFSTIR